MTLAIRLCSAAKEMHPT